MIFQGYILIYLYLIILLLTAYILNKQFKVKSIIIRKAMHIMLSFSWFISYYFFGSSFHLFIPPITFVLINLIAYHKDFFKWQGEGKNKGIIYYPLSFLILAVITYLHPPFYFAFGIGFLCMGIGDGFAPLVAGYLKSRQIINNKTLTGSATVFIVSFLIALSFSLYFDLNYDIFKLLIIGSLAFLLELIGVNGLDNLYVPLGIASVSFLLGVI